MTALSELPGPDVRWVIQRKSTVVAAVRSGLLTLEEACQRYRLSTEEFLSWQKAVDAHGLHGLRAMRVQFYRNLDAQRAREGDGRI